MAKRKKTKRHTGRIIVSVLLIVVAAGLFIGRNAIIDGLRTKAVKTVATKLLEEQLSKAAKEVLGSNVDVDVSEVIDNMEEEDIEKAVDIAEKYVEPGKLEEYVEMVRDGDIARIKQQVKEELSEEDKQELRGLYEKYKDQIPLDQIPADQIPLDQIPLDQIPLDQIPVD